MLSEYAQNTRPNNPDSWAAVGFKVKRPRSKPQPLEMIREFRHFIARSIPSPDIKLRWKRPFDSQRGDVKGYIVQRNNTAEYPVAPEGKHHWLNTKHGIH